MKKKKTDADDVGPDRKKRAIKSGRQSAPVEKKSELRKSVGNARRITQEYLMTLVPKIKASLIQKFGDISFRNIATPEEMLRILSTTYDSLPLPLRLLIKKEFFVNFFHKNSHLIDNPVVRGQIAQKIRNEAYHDIIIEILVILSYSDPDKRENYCELAFFIFNEDSWIDDRVGCKNRFTEKIEEMKQGGRTLQAVLGIKIHYLETLVKKLSDQAALTRLQILTDDIYESMTGHKNRQTKAVKKKIDRILEARRKEVHKEGKKRPAS